MATDDHLTPDEPADERTVEAPRLGVADRAITLARQWITVAAEAAPDMDAQKYAEVVADPRGIAFAQRFADGVLRPEGLATAAESLRRLAPDAPEAMPWFLRGAVRLGGAVAPVLPAPVVPLSRRVMRDLAGHLVLDARPGKLTAALAAARERGQGVSVTPVGPAVLGADGAAAYAETVRVLRAHPDVDDVVVTVSGLIGRVHPWAFDDTVARLSDALRAAVPTDVVSAATTPASVTVLVRTPAETDLVIAALIELLEDPATADAPIGIALPAAHIDTIAAVRQLAAWARSRAEVDERPLHVRILAEADTAESTSRAALRGTASGVLAEPGDIHAAALRAVEELVVGGSAYVRAQLQTADPFLAAAGIELATEVGASLRILLPIGLPSSLQAAVTAERRDRGEAVLVSAPVAAHGDVDLAISRILRRADASDVLVRTTRLGHDADVLATEAQRIDGVLARRLEAPEASSAPAQDRAAGDVPAPDTRLVRPPAPPSDDGLTQEVIGIARSAAATDTTPLALSPDGLPFGGTPFVETAVLRTHEDATPAAGAPGFDGAPDTDPASAPNREWAAALFPGLTSDEGVEGDEDTGDDGLVGADLTALRSQAETWANVPAAERGTIVRRIGAEIQNARGALITALIADTGATFAHADDEVTRTVDAAAFAASTARELDAVSGAVFTPWRLTAVITDARSDLLLPAEAALSALASGSAVLLCAPLPHTLTVFADIAARAGLPSGLLAAALGVEGVEEAIGSDDIDHVIAHGNRDRLEVLATARGPRSFAGTVQGKNAVIVTPSADVDDVVTDLIASTFTGSGRGAHAASLVILVGSIGRSRRIAAQLLDAVRSLHTGLPDDPRTDVGPLAQEPSESDRWALTTLDAGEEWLVQPRELGPRLWTPGVRVGIQPGARFHREVFSVPVLGVMAATTLGEAIRMQNAVAAHHSAGLMTRNAADISAWADSAIAGSLAVNRPLPAPRSQRHPVGGWDGTTVGTRDVAGSPHRVAGFGSWRASAGRPASSTLHLRGLDSRITTIIEAAQPDLDYASFDAVRRGALSDAIAWDREFGRVRDVTRLQVERNLLRYRRLPVAIRATEGTPIGDLLRVILAGIRAGSAVTISATTGLPAALRHALAEQSLPYFLETDQEWTERLTASDVRRARIIGPGAQAAVEVLRAVDPMQRIAVHRGDPLALGRIELAPFLREQAISITAHRFGGLDPWSEPAI